MFIFENISYHKPHNNNYGREIRELIGLDSETLVDGSPFLFCTSTGDSFDLTKIPDIFFTRDYIDRHFGVYNLKFDSGSLLYHLSVKALNILRVDGEVDVAGVLYRYIPHKRLRIIRNGHGVTFWNVAQFFRMSLDNAAQKYLGESKDRLTTKRFTKSYVAKHREQITKYCVRDAVLTSKLYDYFVSSLHKFKLTPTSLYSTASLSYQYFRQNITIPDVWDLWCKHKYILKLACWSYAGGKFEILRRGKFSGYNYDINSAYPYEMSRLKSLARAKLICRSRYMPEADYGFLKVAIDNSSNKFLPVTIRPKGYNIYPAGVYYSTITKQEYDYLKSLDIPVKIYSAFWIVCRENKYPFKNIVDHLYKIKSEYKNSDARAYQNTKIILNSFYGKMAQLIYKNDGKIIAGNCWNPVYSSVITANTRIRICEMQNKYKPYIYAVHTDSVLTTKKLPQNILSDGMGEWQMAGSGDGVVVACGLYQIGRKYALRGFNTTDKRDLKNILNDAGKNHYSLLEQLSVKSWVECSFRNKKSLTNRFIYEKKRLDFNQDVKRNWECPMSGYEYLEKTQLSMPLIVMQRNNPFD